MKHCPTCVTELKPNNRRLGKGSKNWLVCDSCGYREKKDAPDTPLHIINTLSTEELNGFKELD